MKEKRRRIDLPTAIPVSSRLGNPGDGPRIKSVTQQRAYVYMIVITDDV